VPLVLLFDGIVSCLRTYSPPELRELTNGLGDCRYHWSIGCVKRGRRWLPITYLVGYPAGKVWERHVADERPGPSMPV